jgi:histidine triad (HIT) family protein
MPACVFCDIVARGAYAYENEYCVAFEPINPVVPGHLLVIPREHGRSAIDAPKLAGHAMEYAGELAAEMKLPAANFITSAGAEATQTVFHVHVHIVPRVPGDEVALPWTEQAKQEEPAGLSHSRGRR